MFTKSYSFHMDFFFSFEIFSCCLVQAESIVVRIMVNFVNSEKLKFLMMELHASLMMK
jgi:hypothetical protein